MKMVEAKLPMSEEGIARLFKLMTELSKEMERMIKNRYCETKIKLKNFSSKAISKR